LQSLLSRAGIKGPLRVAYGTYDDVLHWLRTGAVDMAVVTPAVLSQALEQAGAIRWEYVAAVRSTTEPSDSRSVAVVRDDSPIRAADDLRQLLARGRGRLLLVDPFSTSGALAPRVALAAERISLPESRVHYTHSHTRSLDMIRSATSGEEVAFVRGGALTGARMQGLRRLEIPALARLRIPADALIVRGDLPSLARLKGALDGPPADRGGISFHVDPAWREGDAAVRDWLATARGVSLERMRRLDLDEFGSLLLLYARSQPTPLRLAVVFSGGGAKCSYQIGALRAIEEKLAALRRETGDESIDIGLVVGTSGGAINALPVAMGMSSTPPQCDELDAVWCSLDQREIIRPAFAVRLNMSLWFASVQFLIFSWLCRRRGDDRARARLARWILCIAAGACGVLLVRLPYDPWRLLGPRPGLHRLYLWLSFGAEGAGWVLIATGGFGLALRAAGAEARPRLLRFGRLVRNAAFAGVVLLPLLQTWTIFGHEPTLSEGQGLEATLFHRYSRLVAVRDRDGRPSRSKPPSLGEGGSRREAFQALSRRILGEGLLTRDLVLTGSVLGAREADLPPDLYFWASAGRTTAQPTFGARGVAMGNRPELLLDALIGSGAIYPVFPARVLHDFPRIGLSTEVVDGSFAHRSPVEAAVLWGATHIILIQADPDELAERGGFGANIAAALTHLYDQAQLTDGRTREQAMLFSLGPRPPHIGLLDFASNLIAASLAKGYREVKGDPDGGAPQPPPFLKEVGVPHFVWLPAADDDASRSSQ
jgi:predicted acylesterase/phospholipase RssA